MTNEFAWAVLHRPQANSQTAAPSVLPPPPSVIPANAGTHGHGGPSDSAPPQPKPQPWVPASAGMTEEERWEHLQPAPGPEIIPLPPVGGARGGDDDEHSLPSLPPNPREVRSPEVTPPARTQAAIELLDQIIAAARESGAAADTLIAR